jgi:hypothetical protein
MGMNDGSKPFTTTTLFEIDASAIVLVGLFLVGGCQPPRTARLPTVSLRLRGAPPEATVIIDDNAIGTFDFVAAQGVALPLGTHRITVAASGYFPWDHTVEAQASSGPISLQVTLLPVPD